jgi:hypothetical protein
MVSHNYLESHEWRDLSAVTCHKPGVWLRGSGSVTALAGIMAAAEVMSRFAG